MNKKHEQEDKFSLETTVFNESRSTVPYKELATVFDGVEEAIDQSLKIDLGVASFRRIPLKKRRVVF